MIVKELKEKLETMDENLEVKTRERYSAGVIPVTVCKEEFKTLNKTYCYIG